MSDVNSPAEPIKERVRQLLDAGAPVSIAIQVALAPSREREDVRTSIPRFAERHGRNPKSAAHAIYGGRSAPDWLLEDLAADLGGTPDQWRELLRYGDRLGLAAVAV